jgi:hypothetical protein
MRARLTHIALRIADRQFEIGDEVVGGEDLPMEVLTARLLAGTAELVLPPIEISPELKAVIDRFAAASGQLLVFMGELVRTALTGPPGSARVVLNAIHAAERAPTPDLVQLLDQLEDRAEADQAFIPADLSPEGSPAQGETEAGGQPAASEAGGVDGPPPAENSSGSPAFTDAPQPEAGRGEPAGAAAPAAEPSAPSTSSTAKKRAPRKGARED